ncbi:MAG: UDP-glucose dehydrogenase family protein [Flavobacteriales bacterium]
MKIAVIGTGYVGLVTGTCLAETGNHVFCVDIDESKVERLRSGKVTIYEPGLEPIFERNISQGRLHFTTHLDEAVEEAIIIFLALPTPPGEDGSADLSYILDVAKSLGPLIKDYKIIVNKSTVPVGTAEKVRKAIAENTHAPFDVVSNPEFLREGYAVEDFMKPDRVVVGASSERAVAIMHDLYRPYVRQGNPILFMDEHSSELTKYAANSFLATKISFMNEIANLCEKLGADVDMVRMGMGSDSRIGKRFLFPGIGYGGSCFPKDVQALVQSASDSNYDFSILRAVMNVNTNQKTRLIPLIRKKFGADLSGTKVAVWGLSFKPNTDDIREAPSLDIIKELLNMGAEISAFDPEAMSNVQALVGNDIQYGKDSYAVLEDADLLVICTEWSVFRTPDFEKMRQLMKQLVIFDGRNLYDLDVISSKADAYFSIGRRAIDNMKQ